MDSEILDQNLKKLSEKMVTFHNDCCEKYGDHDIGYDLGAMQLVVVDENQEMLEAFPIIIIGSHCRETNTYIWGWANEELMESTRTQARSLIDMSTVHETNEFTAPLLTFKKGDKTGYYPSEIALPHLLAMSVDHLGAITLERFDFGNTDCYVAVMPSLKVDNDRD